MARVTTHLGELKGIKELPASYDEHERLLVSGDPYRHDAHRTYPFGYSLADLGPREPSHESHRDPPASPALTKGA